MIILYKLNFTLYCKIKSKNDAIGTNRNSPQLNVDVGHKR